MGRKPGSCVFLPLFLEWVLGFPSSMTWILGCPSPVTPHYRPPSLPSTFPCSQSLTCSHMSSPSHQAFPNSQFVPLSQTTLICHFLAGLKFHIVVILSLMFSFPLKTTAPSRWRLCLILLLLCSKTLKYFLEWNSFRS